MEWETVGPLDVVNVASELVSTLDDPPTCKIARSFASHPWPSRDPVRDQRAPASRWDTGAGTALR